MVSSRVVPRSCFISAISFLRPMKLVSHPALQLQHRPDRVRRIGEYGVQPIPDHLYDPPTMRVDGIAAEAVMAHERIGHPPERFPIGACCPRCL